jgi:hypothetical protein
LYARYKHQVEFFHIYISEVHPSLDWSLDGVDEIHIPQAASMHDRTRAARACAAHTEIKFSVLLDEMDNSTSQAYEAMPDRLYLVGEDGRISYQSDRGPQGFDVDELTEALESLPPTPTGIGNQSIGRSVDEEN